MAVMRQSEPNVVG